MLVRNKLKSIKKGPIHMLGTRQRRYELATTHSYNDSLSIICSVIQRTLAMNMFRKGLKFKLSVLVITMLMVALLGPGSAFAAAETFTSSLDFPLDILVYVSCANGGAGEEVQLTGSLHDVFHVTFTSNGRSSISVSDNPQGVSGYGLTTGVQYQGTGITRFSSGIQIGSEDTFVNNFRIIGQGTDNNYLVHENFHITVNANGTLTAYHDNFSIECR